MTNWAIIGGSGFAETTCIPTLESTNSATLLGCCGSNPEKNAELTRKFGLPKTFNNIEEVGLDPDVEAVWIASPTGMHGEQAESLMRSGKAVLIEKPLELNYAKAKKIVRAALETNAQAAVGFHQRFKLAHIHAKSLISSGDIGNPVFVNALFMVKYPSPPGKWRQHRDSSGGWSINDIGTHLIDTVKYVLGAEVRKAKAVFGNNQFRYETDDIFSAVLELNNDSIATISASTAVDNPKTRLEIIGTKGSLNLENSFMGSTEMFVNGQQLPVFNESMVYVDQIHAFQKLLLGQQSEISNLGDGLDNVYWVEQMVKET